MSEYCKTISGDFTCKFCGRTFKDIRTMVLNTCIKNPTRGGRQSPARQAKIRYIVKQKGNFK